jgi:ribosomal peptide maturation radical SAM protein 1
MKIKAVNQDKAARPVILVSAPWAMYNRPSIQLGVLKAHLGRCFSDLPVRAEHFHLSAAAAMGYPLYQAVSEQIWIAECVAAILLFPEQAVQIERLFARESKGIISIRTAGLRRLAHTLDEECSRFIAGIDWSGFGLAGFSVSLCQMTCTMLLIRRIKREHPELPVVVGGASFYGESFEALSCVFPGIDHLVRGEGEAVLAELADAYCRGERAVPQSSCHDGAGMQVQDLDELPMPYFEDYFDCLQNLDPERQFYPILPVEGSRGCWWIKKPRPDDPAEGCAFCNLNRHWIGYRNKSPHKIAGEIESLSNRYRTLCFSFMDNLLPRKGAGELFSTLAASGREYRLFGEIRADTPAGILAVMRRAGMREVQVGIESLSSALLKSMNKGTCALDNIEVMRHCEALGMHHGGNLLMHFPGSTAEDVEETLTNMSYADIYLPLRPVIFWLGLKSPAFCNPDRYGISLKGNDPRWSALIPPALARKLRFTVQGYTGGKGEQERLWRPVKKQLRRWRKDYDLLMRGPNSGPVLGYQDGRDFLVINRRRPDKTSDVHRLLKTSREIYLFCRTSRSWDRIQAQFPHLAADKLDVFLRMMVDRRLMFGESRRFLSLAVPMDRGAEELTRF